MKKHYVILMLMVSIFTTSRAQSTTHYGEGIGTAGYRGSYIFAIGPENVGLEENDSDGELTGFRDSSTQIGLSSNER